ncbi:MAG: BMP family protein [Acidimicrobiales bacterium]
MTRRKPLTLLLALLAVFALVAAACGSDDDGDDTGSDDTSETTAADDDAETSETTAAEDDDEAAGSGETFRIAVVAPSASNDLAFTQSMVDALDAVAETRDIEVDITDGVFVVEDAAAALRGYAEDDYDLIIAHGSQYGAPLEEIAADFPDVAFTWGTSIDTFDLPNVSAYTTRSDEGGYVMGVMAGAITESGVIGVVGPIEVGDAALYVSGFENGVAAQSADVTVNTNWIESFSDVALAAEAATAHVGAGADILTGTAQMVTGATGVASEEGVLWFGTQANQTSLGEDNVVASQVYHWEVILEDIIADIEAGTLGGNTYTLNLENGGLIIEYNDGYTLDPAVQTLAEETIEGIIDGSITTGVS